MIRICTILLLCGFFVGQAWADDGYPVFGDDITSGTFALDGITSFDYQIELPDDPLEMPISIEWQNGKTSEYFTLGDIRAILERCLEYVPEDPPGIDYVDPDSIRRKELRRDIEAMRKRLTNGSNGSQGKEG